MRICAVNSQVFASIYASQGHEVLDLRLEPGPRDIVEKLDEHGFEPDLLLEVEMLRPRTLLCGLGNLSCTKVFWSVDTHLNAWWHRAYGRLFDLVLTTQDSWVPTLRMLGLANVEHLPWFGPRRACRPWNQRSHKLSFVGRITGERPVRKRLVEHLDARHGLTLVQDATHAQMLELYDDTWIVPNESIFSEVNFRLFEAAACGCLVLNQAVSSDVTRLFEPGREIEVYEDVVELDMLLARRLADPEGTRAMARAAWARVQAEHLAVHRAARILELADGAKAAATGSAADGFVWQAMYHLNEAGMFQSNLKPVAENLSRCGHTPEGAVTLMRCLNWMGRQEEALGLAAQLAAERLHPGNFEVNLAASALALRHGRWDLAKVFWVRHAKHCGARCSGMPGSVFELWLLWARECDRQWLSVRSGFSYDSARGVAGSALDCLIQANELQPDDLAVVERMSTVFSRLGSGGFGIRLQALSHLALHRPKDWRLGLELARVNLKALRLKEGLEELHLAYDAAVARGQGERFMKALAARDAMGALARMLRDASGAPVVK